jgi:LPXTG-motif cell wall-anchored protein
MKFRELVFFSLGVALMMAWSLTVITQAQGSGNCQSGWEGKVESAPFSYSGTETITKVIVKSGQGCFVFLRNGSNGCYRVSGIGTTSAKVVQDGEAGPECQEISHAEFYVGDPPPPTNTPTATDGTISLNTPTQATPFKFWTFTPPPTYPPPTTPEFSPTPSGTPEVTLTFTPTSTQRRGKTPTPKVLLPQTGEDGRNNNEMVFAIAFILIVVGIVITRRKLA